MTSKRKIYRLGQHLLVFGLQMLVLAVPYDLHAQNFKKQQGVTTFTEFRTRESAPPELRDTVFESKLIENIWHFRWSARRSTSYVFHGLTDNPIGTGDWFVMLVTSPFPDSKVIQLAIRPDGSYVLNQLEPDPEGNLSSLSDAALADLKIELANETADRLEIRGSIPLESLSAAFPGRRSISEIDLIRLGLLCSQSVPSRDESPEANYSKKRTMHWASWKSIPANNTSIFSTSCMGHFRMNGENLSGLQETNRARQMRWATEKVQEEYLLYRHSPPVRKKAREWYDQIQTFPTPVQDPIAFEWQSPNSDMSQWKDAAFFDQSLHIQFETKAMESDEGIPRELWRLTNDSGQTIQCTYDMGEISFVWSDSNRKRTTQWVCKSPFIDHRAHEFSLVSPGTGDAQNMRVYCDGKPLSLQVLRNEMYDLTMVTEWATKQKGNWQFLSPTGTSRLAGFRIIQDLPTAIEIRSTSSDEPWFTWEELPQDLKENWVQHFVQKVDLDGVYLHESMMHYSRGRMSSQ